MQKRRKYRTKKRIREKKQKIAILVIFVFFVGAISLVGYNFKTGVFSLLNMTRLGASVTYKYSCPNGGVLYNGIYCKYTTDGSSAVNVRKSCDDYCKSKFGSSYAGTCSKSERYYTCVYKATKTEYDTTSAKNACDALHKIFNETTGKCTNACKSGYTKNSSGNCVKKSSSTTTTTDDDTSTTTTTTTKAKITKAQSATFSLSVNDNNVPILKITTTANGIKSIMLQENNSKGDEIFSKTFSEKTTKSYTISASNIKLPSKGKKQQYYLKITDHSGFITYSSFVIGNVNGTYKTDGSPIINYSKAGISGTTVSKFYFTITDYSGLGDITYKNSSGDWVNATVTDSTKSSSGVVTTKTVSIPYSALTKKGNYSYVYVKAKDKNGYTTIRRFRFKKS